MTAPVIEVELVAEGHGTLKYLVVEAGQIWVSPDIHELLEDVNDLDKAEIFLLTPDMQNVPVSVSMGEHDDDWWVSLGGKDDDGEPIERVVYAENPTERHQIELHVQHVHGWTDPDQ